MPRIKTFDHFCRPSGIREVKPKYFFALEGEKTEPQYIATLAAKKGVLSDCLYYFHNGDYNESNNLAKMTDLMVLIKDGKEKPKLTYHGLVNEIWEIYANRNECRTITVRDKIASCVESCVAKLGKKLNDPIAPEDLDVIFDKLDNNSQVFACKISEITTTNDLEKVITDFSTYSPEVDKIVIIGDRDIGDFTPEQYDKVLNKVEENNFALIISNPCIEFWFLLHHTDAKNVDKSSWAIGKNAAALALEELKKCDPTYKKKNFDVNFYYDNTPVAIENVKNYCTDLVGLKTKIGSNFKDLFDLLS